MSPTTARWVAWAMWAVAVAGIAAGAVLSARYPFTSVQETYDPVGEAVWAASWLGFGFVGALIVSQRPRNRIGWLLVSISFLLSIGVVSPAYARVAFQHPEAGVPLGQLATWLAMWVVTPAFGAVLALLLLFPSGALATRRQRVIAALLAVAVVVTSVMRAFSPGPPEGDAPPFNPLGIIALEDQLKMASGVVGGAFAFIAFLVLLDFLYRFWRSRGVQRQQFRWLTLAAAAFPPLFMSAILAEDRFLGSEGFDPAIAVFFVCGNGLAAAIGIAVTKHGLYEINRVISRSVSYVVLSALLISVYLLAVTALTAVTAPVTDESPVAVAAATLLAAAVFGPARRRIQTTVDRRFNRARYDAAQTVEVYRHRLREEVDIGALSEDLLTTVTKSMQPAGAVLWLRGGR